MERIVSVNRRGYKVITITQLQFVQFSQHNKQITQLNGKKKHLSEPKPTKKAEKNPTA